MDYYEQITDNQLKVKLVANGNPSKIYSLKLKKDFTYKQLQRSIQDKMRINSDIRIFLKGGVEIEPEEVRFIKQNEILYISNGEDFDLNSHLAEYKILKEVGSGGYGIVYEGKHRLTKQRVAIKMVKNSKVDFKEISALKFLRHKHIIKILNSFYIEKELKMILILEYLEGGELKKYLLEQGKLCEEEAQFFFRQIYSAVSYCHRQNIIHRDLKLENIMLTDRISKQIKVVDFGISGVRTNISIDYTEAGSVRYYCLEIILYMAPEVLEKRAPAHSGIDIWAMGVILYWLLHGYPPFDGRTKGEIIKKVISREYKITAEITKACHNLLKAMLQGVNERINIHEIGEHQWMQKDVDVILNQEAIPPEIKLREIPQPQQIRIRLSNTFAKPTQSYLNRINKQENFLSPQNKRKSVMLETIRPQIQGFLTDFKRT